MANLWILGNQESFRGIADRFNLSKGSLHYVFLQICQGLKNVRREFIRWPDNHQLVSIAEQFGLISGFPGIIGAIDGTHIPIPGPSRFRASYINKKGYPSIHHQAICDINLKF